MIGLLALIPGLGQVVAFLRVTPWAARLANGLGVALLALAVVMGGYWKGRWDERAAVAQARAAAEARADLKKAQADAAAGRNLEAASAVIAKQQETQDRADDHLPDTRPSDVRLARYCAGLSDADRAKVPRCRPGGQRAGADAHR